MEKLVGRRNAQLVQVKWQLAAAEKLHERNASHGEVLDRLEQLQDLARKFRDTQSEIEENQPDPEAIASVHIFREEFNTHFYRAKDALERYISHNDNDDDGDNSSIRGSSGSYRSVAGSSRDLREAMQMLLEAQRTMMLQSSGGGANVNVDPAGGEQMPNHAPFANVRLPAINVPTFDGDRKNWRSFKDIFVQTIHARRDLRDSLKMQYLVSYLSDDAKRLVNSFPISDANYKEAWAALSNFYDKKKYTVFSLVREFVEQPVITNATADNLRKLVTTSDEVVRQLNALGAEYNTRDPWLIHLLLEKLDKDIRSLWAQRIIDVENPSYETRFLKFLDNRCDALETCTAFSRKVTTDAQRKDPGKKMQAEKKMQSLHATTVIQKCAKCSSEHPIHMCEDFKKMDLQCKRELVQKAKLCYNCFRPSHSAKNCASKSVCRIGGCKQRHHTLLCPKIENSSDRKEERSDDPKQPTQPSRDPVDVVSSLVVQVPKPLNETFVLPTALINVKAVDGGFLKCRALIDSGSGASLITEACVNKLGIPRTNGKVVAFGLAQQSAGTTRGIVKLVIANRCNEAVILRTSAQWEKIGADVFLAILQPEQVKDELENPVAQNTIFGWIVRGNQSIYTAGIPSNVSIINLHIEVDVNRTLRQFWEQEEVPKSQQLAPEEQAAVHCFRSTTTRDDSGRFIVRLPFDESKPALGESLTPAIKRLRAMEKRFERDPVFHRQYCDFVEEYLALRHMEEDRDFQRVVWRSDPGEPINHFRLCTVTYGTKPAPYLAIEAMREAARNYETVYPEAAQRIVLDVYVDDFMSGAKNIDEARQIRVIQVCEILRSAEFNLRKWTTNRPELLSDNEYTEQMPVEMKLAEQPEAVKALGIQWLPKDDVFSLKVSLSVDSVNTKRQLLSDSSRLFDPYGWLSPIMVKIKILFQQL
ncbi:uncharacterized protein LOC134288944 [Aedes albopictus]|uniref:Peptidase A2 domain-containing protein n=1 Tax=Aedes albopictus TaxID=7160 RepID=A0ABM1ZV06_AEDAL